MTYRERLACWAVVRLLPTQQWVVVARFYHRSNAEGYCRFVQRAMPQQVFQVVFDVPPMQK
jgi:hypothetical protein